MVTFPRKKPGLTALEACHRLALREGQKENKKCRHLKVILMKKEISILALITSLVFVGALVAPAIAWPESHNNPLDYNCICTHWREDECPDYYDDYTGAGLTGTYQGSNDYSDVYIQGAESGYGGWYPYWPNSPTSIYVYYGAESDPQHGTIGGLSAITQYLWGSPSYPVYKSWNGQGWNYYVRSWNYHLTNQPLNMTFVEVQQWFYSQQFPGQAWLDGGGWIEVYTS
jgi:hypothetical protein